MACDPKSVLVEEISFNSFEKLFPSGGENGGKVWCTMRRLKDPMYIPTSAPLRCTPCRIPHQESFSINLSVVLNFHTATWPLKELYGPFEEFNHGSDQKRIWSQRNKEEEQRGLPSLPAGRPPFLATSNCPRTWSPFFQKKYSRFTFGKSEVWNENLTSRIFTYQIS